MLPAEKCCTSYDGSANTTWSVLDNTAVHTIFIDGSKILRRAVMKVGTKSFEEIPHTLRQPNTIMVSISKENRVGVVTCIGKTAEDI